MMLLWALQIHLCLQIPVLRRSGIASSSCFKLINVGVIFKHSETQNVHNLYIIYYCNRYNYYTIIISEINIPYSLSTYMLLILSSILYTTTCLHHNIYIIEQQRHLMDAIRQCSEVGTVQIGCNLALCKYHAWALQILSSQGHLINILQKCFKIMGFYMKSLYWSTTSQNISSGATVGILAIALMMKKGLSEIYLPRLTVSV